MLSDLHSDSPLTRLPSRGERVRQLRTRLPERRGGGYLPRELDGFMQPQGVLLVIVERGGALPNWVFHCQDRVSDVVVVASGPEDNCQAIEERVAQRLLVLRDSEDQLGVVVVVTAMGDRSREHIETRHSTAKAVIAHLEHQGHGRMVFLTDDDLSSEGRVELLSLASSLAQHLGSADVSITIRFGGAMDETLVGELLAPRVKASERRLSRRPPRSGRHPKADAVAEPPASQIEAGSVPSSRRRPDSAG